MKGTINTDGGIIKIELKPTKSVTLSHNGKLNLEDGKAWVTFMDEDWGNIWHPVIVCGHHIDFHDKDGFSRFAMDVCREVWGDGRGFGLSDTECMLQGHTCRDNF